MDCDPVRATGVAATDEEHEAGIEAAKGVRVWLQESVGFPAGVLADSGNGGHLIFGINEPNDADTDKLIGACLEAVKRIQFPEVVTNETTGKEIGRAKTVKAVKVKWDTSIKNAARIFRLYGTWNCKGTHTPERPHRLACIIEAPETLPIVQRETLERLAELGGEHEANEALEKTIAKRIDMRWNTLDEGKPKMRAWIKTYLGENAVKSEGEWIRDGETWWKFVLAQCPFNDEHNRGEACILIKGGHPGVRSISCRHDSCAGVTWQDLRDHVGDVPPSKARKGRTQKRASQTILELVGSTDHELFRSTDGIGFLAMTDEQGRKRTLPLDSMATEYTLRYLFLQKTGGTIATDSLREAIATLNARAYGEGKEHKMFLRTAYDEDARYIDLANEAGDVVRYDKNGWDIVNNPPVRFYRTPNQAALPRPIRGGSLDLLHPFVNVADEDRTLTYAFLCDCCKGHGPYHVLNFSGDQGSGKTTSIFYLSSVIDPQKEAQTAGLPRKEDDLAVIALNTAVVVFDNLSGMPADMSDALCRLVTGGGIRSRKFYQQRDLLVFGFCRPVILNGIGDVIHAPDLLDRTLLVSCPTLDGKHKRQSDMQKEFAERHPAIFGGLLDVCVAGLNDSDTGDCTRNMESYQFMYHCAAKLPGGSEGFKTAYQRVRGKRSRSPMTRPRLPNILQGGSGSVAGGWRIARKTCLIGL